MSHNNVQSFFALLKELHSEDGPLEDAASIAALRLHRLSLLRAERALSTVARGEHAQQNAHKLFGVVPISRAAQGLMSQSGYDRWAKRADWLPAFRHRSMFEKTAFPGFHRWLNLQSKAFVDDVVLEKWHQIQPFSVELFHAHTVHFCKSRVAATVKEIAAVGGRRGRSAPTDSSRMIAWFFAAQALRELREIESDLMAEASAFSDPTNFDVPAVILLTIVLRVAFGELYYGEDADSAENRLVAKLHLTLGTDSDRTEIAMTAITESISLYEPSWNREAEDTYAEMSNSFAQGDKTGELIIAMLKARFAQAGLVNACPDQEDTGDSAAE